MGVVDRFFGGVRKQESHLDIPAIKPTQFPVIYSVARKVKGDMKLLCFLFVICFVLVEIVNACLPPPGAQPIYGRRKRSLHNNDLFQTPDPQAVPIPDPYEVPVTEN
ncbi:unnamed protein product [Bursaphelenchus xylophilus]|uniref:(pine wood nematode) hypothetical protein n=1 Tax=Bursaphelenchus xylophilus TaxID=6326 RepID=A0A1I7S7W2_BURXY|nr:unnamed protein product [Bursaphelenchus xylophilus]CAG9087131.1 unnamed protein product [Bursaphelenchus xylophilus]